MKILVKPLHYLNGIFVLFLVCQFSLLHCVMHKLIKAFNHCLSIIVSIKDSVLQYVQILSIIFLNK